MKKNRFPILIAVLLVVAGLSVWVGHGYSQEAEPQGAEDAGSVGCAKAMVAEQQKMRKAWNGNLEALRSQEKPASEMVDEAYESLRTYRCWLNYLCESVMFSGTAIPEMYGTQPLTSSEIDPLPGCVDPGKVKIPETSLHIIPECKATPSSNQLNALAIGKINDNYQWCRRMIEKEIGMVPRPNETSEESEQSTGTRPELSSAFISLDRALKDRSGEQLMVPVRDKLVGIAGKLSEMETHVMYLKGFLDSLYNRIICFCPTCN